MRHSLRLLVALAVSFALNPAKAELAGDKFELCKLPAVERVWKQLPRQIDSVASRKDSTGVVGTTEQPYRVTLLQCASALCKASEFHALIPVFIPRTGRYRVAVDQMLWIDAYDERDKQEGVLCEHAGCAPIRKIVQYDFKAGAHWIALTAKSGGEVGLLVTDTGGM